MNEKIHEMKKEGYTSAEIAEQLGMGLKEVNRIYLMNLIDGTTPRALGGDRLPEFYARNSHSKDHGGAREHPIQRRKMGAGYLR